MKTIKYIAIFASALSLVACEKELDKAVPSGGTLLEAQVQETNAALPSRVDATITGMYTMTCEPLYVKFSSKRPDNFGFAMMDYSNDMECADLITADSGYNWFSTCMELSSRNADYANPYIRYKVPYDVIAVCNTIIKSYPEDTKDPEIICKIAQAKTMRAYCYERLAPYFQFTYASSADKPCVPIVTEGTEDFTNNKRATVKDVYDLIVSDLSYAVDSLSKYKYVRSDKAKIDAQVALALRARAYLEMCEWQKAYDDAVAAAEGYAPASLESVKKPSFMDINEPNWIWGYDMTTEMAKTYPYATASSWLRSFSANGYTPACQCYACINNLLWNKIPVSDVRKGWWVDEDLKSPLLNGLKWPGFDDVAHADDGGDTKTVFLPYTNVKFGCYTVGTQTNDEDWPFIRVEEMILIQAECQARLGQEGNAQKILGDFITTYRDPNWTWGSNPGLNAIDKIWFQRRVELWGEGFANSDCRRYQKPMVRFHKGEESNVPDNFRFNMKADDGWWLLRFCTDEKNTNKGIIDNTEGKSPELDQNGELRDGVTDII